MFLRLGKEDLKVALKDSGVILEYSALSFFVPIILAVLIDKNINTVIAYGAAAVMIFLFGYALRHLIKVKKETEARHALFSTVIIWLVYCLFASLPFVFIMRVGLLDAYFESMSALTTTGLTVMRPLLGSMPASLIFWRSFLSWVGGVGIIVLAFLGLMTTYSKASKLLSAEGRGDSLKGNLKNLAKKIMGIYLVLTVAGIILLMFSGQTPWEATNYSMSAISTTGMDITPAGLAGVNNGWLPTGVYNNWVAISLVIIMIWGAMSFSLHYLMFTKKQIGLLFKDAQFKTLIIFGLIGTLIISAKLGLMSSFFHTFSAFTCGGFAAVTESQAALWDDFVKGAFVMFMLVGGAAGSTAGGIKISRAIIFVKSIYWRIKQSLLPEGSVFRKSFEGNVLTDGQLKKLNQFILLWILFIIIGTLVISFNGYGFTDALFEVTSAQGNAGISVGISQAGMNPVVEGMLIINMFIGRLEIIPILTAIGFLIALRRR